MKKYILLMAILLTVTSCGSKKLVLGNETFAFESLGNDVADVNLAFYDNGTFQLKALLFPMPETASRTEKIAERGNFIQDDEWLTLTFDNSFNANDFFETQADLKVVNEQTIQINGNAKTVMLLGVLSENSKFLN